MAGDRMRNAAQPGHPADPSAPAAHLPVLFAQVMDGLRVVEDGRYLWTAPSGAAGTRVECWNDLAREAGCC